MDKKMVSSEYVKLNLNAKDAQTAIIEIAEMLFDKDVISSIDAFAADVFKREDTLPTEMEWGVAMPHARSAAVLTPCIAFGRSEHGFYWQSDSKEKTHMVFMFAVPELDVNNTHLKLISSVACALLDEEFRDTCIHAKTREELDDILSQAVLLDKD